MNPRADLFNVNLESKNMQGVFDMQELADEGETVVFKSNLEVGEQVIPFCVLIDNSIFPVIRFFMAREVITRENRDNVREFVNEMNATYKAFKYYIDEYGNIILDACVPALDNFYDPELIHVIIDDVIRDNLSNDYETLMNVIWSKMKTE